MQKYIMSLDNTFFYMQVNIIRLKHFSLPPLVPEAILK